MAFGEFSTLLDSLPYLVIIVNNVFFFVPTMSSVENVIAALFNAFFEWFFLFQI